MQQATDATGEMSSPPRNSVTPHGYTPLALVERTHGAEWRAVYADYCWLAHRAGLPPRPFDAAWRADLERERPDLFEQHTPAPQARTPESVFTPSPSSLVSTPPPHPPCALTIATCDARLRANKRFYVSEDGEVLSQPYDDARKITSKEVPVRGLEDLLAILTWLESQPRRWVMRGKCITDAKRAHRRLVYADGDAPTYEPADRRWACLDLDKLDRPADLPPGDGEAAAKWALELLGLEGVGCVWQWSSSAGLDGWIKVKLHLWVWLSRAVCDESLREWVKATLPLCDPAVIATVQPHYTAAPTFDGVHDPLEGRARCGLIEGAPVELPDEVMGGKAWEQVQRDARARALEASKRARMAREATGLQDKARRYALAALNSGVEALTGSLDGEGHPTLIRESLATLRFVTSGDLELAEWRAAWEAAIQQTFPQAMWRTKYKALDGALRRGGVA